MRVGEGGKRLWEWRKVRSRKSGKGWCGTVRLLVGEERLLKSNMIEIGVIQSHRKRNV